MSKITSEHLSRGAYIYVRQSTPDQLVHNTESQRRQYGLADRARQLGWRDVVVIDEDLGRSGSGALRPGFDRLLAAICAGRVGAVFAIEASRLARNGRDWHTLIEFCGLINTLIVDEDGYYDPRHPNDRLLLGMKGTMSELELSTFRSRSREALKQKAKRGELFLTVAVGYLKVSHDRIEKDPDRRVQEALSLVFRKFDEYHSIRQVYLWLCQERIVLPVVNVGGEEERRIQWRLPSYRRVYYILTNPIYGGAYAFGRTGREVGIENGRKQVKVGIRKARKDWEVLLIDQHEGYITWSQYERNQQIIADNVRGGGAGRGAVRKGQALLAGLFRCGHCGRKLYVAYGGNLGIVGRYRCRGGHGSDGRVGDGTQPCISFGALRVDEAVSAEVLRLLRPLGTEAALQAIETREGGCDEKRTQLEHALEQARYEAALARRQYDAVDPDNRLVAGELESRWNERLVTARALEDELAALQSVEQASISSEERAHLLELGVDLERAWEDPQASAATRKRILRAVIREIVVRIRDEKIELVLHWQGGDHTSVDVPKNKAGHHRWAADGETKELVRSLARLMPDKAIAALLNRAGKRTGRGNTWTQSRVGLFRHRHEIDVYREGERQERGELTLTETAEALGVSKMTVLRLIRDELLPAQQCCRGAPWVIQKASLAGIDSKLTGMGRRGRPRTSDLNQKTLIF